MDPWWRRVREGEYGALEAKRIQTKEQRNKTKQNKKLATVSAHTILLVIIYLKIKNTSVCIIWQCKHMLPKRTDVNIMYSWFIGYINT